MGFWSTVGDIGKGAIAATQKMAEETRQYKEQYSNYDDSKLKEIYRNSGGAKKLAAGALLKERGYGS